MLHKGISGCDSARYFLACLLLSGVDPVWDQGFGPAWSLSSQWILCRDLELFLTVRILSHRVSGLFTDAFEVLAGPGIDLDDFANLDKGRHGHNGTRFDCRGFGQ